MTSKLPNNGVEFPTKSCEEIQDYNYISLQITTPSLAEYPCFPVHTKQAAGQSTKQSLQILNIKITKVVSPSDHRWDGIKNGRETANITHM